jgi:sugar phosphate isomerase/epimerase
MNRRTFLRSAALAPLATVSARLHAQEERVPYLKTIGLQLYTLRNEIKKDPAATLQAVAKAGYHQGEMYGFPNTDAMVQAARDAGLALHSSHFEWTCVTKPSDPGYSDFQRVVEKAKAIGLSHLVVPYLHHDERQGLDGYRRTAAHLNRAATLTKAAGIRLAYHNHAFEFQPQDGGKTGFDIFIEEFSPEMAFEVDVFWVQVGGVDPVALLQRLKGRVTQVHLKDLKAGIPIPSFGGLPADAFQELGNGVIPMPPLLAASRAAGVAICHVEQDQSPDPLASIRQSLAHLRAL